jgi:hypothetical protein
MFEPSPLALSGGRRSDRHGAIERHPALGIIETISRSERYRGAQSLSRNTVRKYLRSGSVEPKFRPPDRPSGLDPYADKLSHILRQEAGKSRKQKRTMKQLYADLTALGYDGSSNRVAAFARDWKDPPTARAEDHGPRRLRAPCVHGRRGVPVRLVRGLGDHRQRADKATG